MISPAEFLKWCEVFNIQPGGGGGGGGATPLQVQRAAFNNAEATGVDDAFIVTLTPAVTSLTDGLPITMNAGTLQNLTTSPTLQVNALTPVPIELINSSVAPEDIQSGGTYLLIYNSDANVFKLINPSVSTANSYLVQANSYNSAIDFGAADAYEVSLTPTPSSVSLGFPVVMRVAPGNTNTGASTLTVNGVTDAIVLNNGSPVLPGALVGNQLAYLLHNGTDWVLLNPQTTGTGFVQSVSGANVKQVIVDNADPENPVLSTPQDIDTDSDVTFNSLTSTADSLINSKTLGTGGGNQLSNTAFGIEALFSNVDGDNNVAIGDNALRANVSGVQSVALGVNAAVVATGGLLTAVGDQALADNVAGAANTAVGALAGQGIVSGNYNSTFGAGSGVSDDATAGALALGANAIADPATGTSSTDDGPGVALGSDAHPIGFRGDGTPYPAGAAGYWRAKINNGYYKIPLLPDATAIQWPTSPGTLALLSDIPAGVTSAQGTESQVLVNGDFSSPQNGNIVLTLPQDIAPASTPAFTGIKLTSPILDTNGDIIIDLTPVASAVNYMSIVNQATGFAPGLLAKGSDTNIDFALQPKGTGKFILGSAAPTTPLTINNGTGLQHSTDFVFANTLNSQSVIFPDASGTLLMTGQAINTVPSINFGGSNLSNYLESTWTPTVTLSGGTGNTVPVYTTNIGNYTRIGNRIFCDVVLTGNGGAAGAGTGQITIALPIVSSSLNSGASSISIGTAVNNVTSYQIYTLLGPGATSILLNYFLTITSQTSFTGAEQNNASRTIRLNFNYAV